MDYDMETTFKSELPLPPELRIALDQVGEQKLWEAVRKLLPVPEEEKKKHLQIIGVEKWSDLIDKLKGEAQELHYLQTIKNKYYVDALSPGDNDKSAFLSDAKLDVIPADNLDDIISQLT